MGSLRDLFVFAVVVGSLPYCFKRPFIGLLLFSWLAYMRVQDLCWGFSRDMRYAYFVAMAMFAGYFVNEYGKRRFMVWDVRTACMVLLVVVTAVSLAAANYQDEYIIERYFEFVKIVFIALFTTAQIDSRARMRVFLWTIALSLGFYGVKNGILGILSGGTPINNGPGGMLGDNNDFALALVMNIPLLLYLGYAEEKPWIKRAAIAAVGLSMVTILLTHSRGGFLALCAVLFVFLMRSQRKVVGLVAIASAVVAFFLLAPQSVLDRIALISQGTAESSANARWTAWALALRMIAAYPILGVGLRNFTTEWPNFTEGIARSEGSYVAHNSYLQIWAEGGTISIVLFLTALGSTFFELGRLRRLVRTRPDLAWVSNHARMFEASGIGFLVGGTFLNRGHFDLIYHLLAAVTALSVLARRQLALQGEGAPELAHDGAPRVVRSETPGAWSWRTWVVHGSGDLLRRPLPRWGR
jgi:probable O-glycosylation ligase (exosortase A-associated)